MTQSTSDVHGTEAGDIEVSRARAPRAVALTGHCVRRARPASGGARATAATRGNRACRAWTRRAHSGPTACRCPAAAGAPPRTRRCSGCAGAWTSTTAWCRCDAPPALAGTAGSRRAGRVARRTSEPTPLKVLAIAATAPAPQLRAFTILRHRYCGSPRSESFTV